MDKFQIVHDSQCAQNQESHNGDNYAKGNEAG